MAFFGYGGSNFPFARGPFREQYRCYSMVFSTKNSEEIMHGGKIIMPPSALEKLARLNITYPMLFKLRNTKKETQTHCGVLEFVAEEGRIYVPHWMMNQLCTEDGDIVIIEYVTLQLAVYSKFQPQTVDFLDIHNPKAVLESKLRSFACLTKGDIIGIEYNKKIYELLVVDTKPEKAVSIIECDMKVDFATPVGYKPPNTTHAMETEESLDTWEEIKRDVAIREAVEKNGNFTAFSGGGQRLDGKINKNTVSSSDHPVENKRGLPNYNYKKRKINFMKSKTLLAGKATESMEEEPSNFVAFSGEGQKLRIVKNKKTH